MSNRTGKEGDAELEALKRELDTMLTKRDQIRSKQMERYRTGSATRAMTTTSNAAADRVNDRIIWLREQITKEVTP